MIYHITDPDLRLIPQGSTSIFISDKDSKLSDAR